MKGQFGCENSRVQLPAILHLVRLGYTYLPHLSFSIKQDSLNINRKTNILTDIFKRQFLNLNPRADEKLALQVLHDITNELDNDDLGEKFYRRLTTSTSEKLIDFENVKNNSFHVTAELSCYDVKDDSSDTKYT
ncbi:MAG: hypothetical protein IJR49_03990, partial [Treponema sp.]|nr:hypothetical protein [Treponema sp.]